MIGEVYASAATQRDDVLKARDEYVAAAHAKAVAWDAVKNSNLDIEIAKRNGLPIEDMVAANREKTSEWVKQMTRARTAAGALAAALGVDGTQLGGDLR